ncbi:MAG: hypothetical protein DDT22_01020 [candidate division WS2 bacterium]|nr:hypothetical protein [Candidatus Lithacetigena glycinireducens]
MSSVPVKRSGKMSYLEFLDRIWTYIKKKYSLGKEDMEFLEAFCFDFSVEKTAGHLGISEKQVNFKQFALKQPIHDFCLLVRRHLKDLAYEELIKSLKQTKSEYLKTKAMELVFKAEGIIKEPSVQVTITVEQRAKMLEEVHRLSNELREIGEKTIDATGDSRETTEVKYSVDDPKK